MKRKIITVIFALLLSSIMCFNASATSNCLTYTVGNKTVQFNADTVFDESTRVYIADLLVNSESDVEPCGLVCALLGHNYESEFVTTITHHASDTAPCCLEETYEVEICTRCDDSIVTRVAFNYISCCPPVEN